MPVKEAEHRARHANQELSLWRVVLAPTPSRRVVSASIGSLEPRDRPQSTVSHVCYGLDTDNDLISFHSSDSISSTPFRHRHKLFKLQFACVLFLQCRIQFTKPSVPKHQRLHQLSLFGFQQWMHGLASACH